MFTSNHVFGGLAGLWFFKDDNKEDEKFLDEYNKASPEVPSPMAKHGSGSLRSPVK